MEMLLEETSTFVNEETPLLASHCIADEHSLDHWMKIYWMVEEENLMIEEMLIPELV